MPYNSALLAPHQTGMPVTVTINRVYSPAMFECDTCGKTFAFQTSYSAHQAYTCKPKTDGPQDPTDNLIKKLTATANLNGKAKSLKYPIGDSLLNGPEHAFAQNGNPDSSIRDQFCSQAPLPTNQCADNDFSVSTADHLGTIQVKKEVPVKEEEMKIEEPPIMISGSAVIHDGTAIFENCESPPLPECCSPGETNTDVKVPVTAPVTKLAETASIRTEINRGRPQKIRPKFSVLHQPVFCCQTCKVAGTGIRKWRKTRITRMDVGISKEAYEFLGCIRALKYTCSLCSLLFKHMTGWRDHMQKWHSTTYAFPHRCHICENGFYDKLSLDIHKSFHDSSRQAGKAGTKPQTLLENKSISLQENADHACINRASKEFNYHAAEFVNTSTTQSGSEKQKNAVKSRRKRRPWNNKKRKSSKTVL